MRDFFAEFTASEMKKILRFAQDDMVVWLAQSVALRFDVCDFALGKVDDGWVYNLDRRFADMARRAMSAPPANISVSEIKKA